MKRILITGADSYIGTSFEKWVRQPQFAGMYEVDTLDMRGDRWKDKDFSGYDSVFHVAGIAHVKENKKNRHLFYLINRDLAINTAIKAQKDGVAQFVLLSSMSVYGIETGVINEKTVPMPSSNYGKSKLEADIIIEKFSDENFLVAIVRPPMVYGKGCKGNYSKLSKLIRSIKIFPAIDNERSMIYIGNLCEFIRILIDKQASGFFFPQNKEFVSISNLAYMIGKQSFCKVHFIKHIDCIISLLLQKSKILKKIFGSLKYDSQLSQILGEKYCVFDLEESIQLTEDFKQ